MKSRLIHVVKLFAIWINKLCKLWICPFFPFFVCTFWCISVMKKQGMYISETPASCRDFGNNCHLPHHKIIQYLAWCLSAMYLGAMVVGIVILVFPSSTGNSMIKLIVISQVAPGERLPTFIWKISGLWSVTLKKSWILKINYFCFSITCSKTFHSFEANFLL